MKNLILLFVFIVSGNIVLAQSAKKFTSGDVELDQSIKSITAYGRKNPELFQKTLVAKFSVTETQAKEYFAGYTGGDLFMIFETAKETKKDAADVFKLFNTNRNIKGWDETLKELG